MTSGDFPQLKAHLKMGKDHGLTKEEVVATITHLAFYAGWPKAWSAMGLAKEVYGKWADAAPFEYLESVACEGQIAPFGNVVTGHRMQEVADFIKGYNAAKVELTEHMKD